MKISKKINSIVEKNSHLLNGTQYTNFGAQYLRIYQFINSNLNKFLSLVWLMYYNTFFRYQLLPYLSFHFLKYFNPSNSLAVLVSPSQHCNYCINNLNYFFPLSAKSKHFFLDYPTTINVCSGSKIHAFSFIIILFEKDFYGCEAATIWVSS